VGVLSGLRSVPRTTARDASRAGHGEGEADGLSGLLKRSGQGDQAAFGELYDSISGLVHGVILKVVRDPSQTEEVTQEVFVEIWRLAPRYDADRGTVTAWAATIAHRRAVDRVRSEQANRTRVERQISKISLEHDSVSEEVIDNDHVEFQRRRVRKALDKLTDMQRQAVELAYFGGHTYREVAVLLDTPEGTVKTRIRDGMIRLRDELGASHE
jgi:RNA polymerase sigma-70 factor (ECF subfamily)